MSVFGFVLVSLLSSPWLGLLLEHFLIMFMHVCFWLCSDVSPLYAMASSVIVAIPDLVHVCLYLALF